MNFLAHIYLSGQNPLLTVGNFIGDFVKGKELENYPAAIKKGIQLHRAIDEFTDNHPTVTESKIRLRSDYGHYAPVIVDVFYDHFLAKNWTDYHTEDLKSFTNLFYQMIHEHLDILPLKAQHMFSYMSRQNWLFEYQFLSGINKALTGMAHRTKFDSGMETASKALEKNYADFEQEFKIFFPQLQKMSQTFIND